MRLNIYDVQHDEKGFYLNNKTLGLEVKWFESEPVILNVAKICIDELHIHQRHEPCMYMWCFNSEQVCLGIFKVFEGMDDIPYRPQDVTLRALLLGASHVICTVHHWEAKAEPHNSDLCFFELMQHVCGGISIKFVDLLVLGNDAVFSVHNNERYLRNTNK